MPYKIIKVSGDSMSPALIDGDYVITKKPRSFQPGFIYVIDHIDLGRIIKRLVDVRDKGLLCFAGPGHRSGIFTNRQIGD